MHPHTRYIIIYYHIYRYDVANKKLIICIYYQCYYDKKPIHPRKSVAKNMSSLNKPQKPNTNRRRKGGASKGNVAKGSASKGGVSKRVPKCGPPKWALKCGAPKDGMASTGDIAPKNSEPENREDTSFEELYLEFCCENPNPNDGCGDYLPHSSDDDSA